jgi:hypothetical protein
MYTIEEAKVSYPRATYNMPKDAEREFGREAIIRAIESKAEAEQALQSKAVKEMVVRAWRKFTRSATAPSAAASATPEASR